MVTLKRRLGAERPQLILVARTVCWPEYGRPFRESTDYSEFGVLQSGRCSRCLGYGLRICEARFAPKNRFRAINHFSVNQSLAGGTEMAVRARIRSACDGLAAGTVCVMHRMVPATHAESKACVLHEGKHLDKGRPVEVCVYPVATPRSGGTGACGSRALSF